MWFASLIKLTFGTAGNTLEILALGSAGPDVVCDGSAPSTSLKIILHTYIWPTFVLSLEQYLRFRLFGETFLGWFRDPPLVVAVVPGVGVHIGDVPSLVTKLNAREVVADPLVCCLNCCGAFME